MMVIRTAFVLFFLSSLCLSATEVPLSMARGTPQCEVEILGKTYRAEIDIGRPLTQFEASALPEEAYSPLYAHLRQKTLSGKTEINEEHLIKELTIGSQVMRDILGYARVNHTEYIKTEDATEIDKKRVKAEVGEIEDPPIVLGIFAFQDKKLFLDFPNKRCQFVEDVDAFRKETPLVHELSCVYENNLLLIRGELGGKQVKWLLDTGTSMNLLFVRGEKDEGVSLKKSPYREIILGGKAFSTGFFEITDAGFDMCDGILGTPFIHMYPMLIDFVNQKVYLNPPVATDAALNSEDCATPTS